MASDLITVCIFGSASFPIMLPNMAPYEAKEFNCHFYDDDSNLEYVLIEYHPHVVITIGDSTKYKKIFQQSIEIRKRWLHYETNDNPSIPHGIMHCFVANATENRFNDMPMVSVFTPTYKTGEKIQRPFQSLLQQTYNNWEWVIYDDSPDDNKTFNEMCELAKQDHRINVYKSNKHSGIIGNVKHNACMVSKGYILVELDHDDELTNYGLQCIVDAFRQFPDAGFAYTDCAEVHDNGQNAFYEDGWGMGYGKYRDNNDKENYYNGKFYKCTDYPNINAKTIRHIVAAPNHIRAWRKDVYFSMGGHSREIHVADDYELCVRTFLKTRMVKIPRLCYIQYYNNSTTGNTQRKRNAEIQRLVKYFSYKYNDEIHKRFLELGVDDFVWTPQGVNWNTPNPAVEQYANYISKI
jgi:glycosyltransferase involved in cell wall biosynthesis